MNKHTQWRQSLLKNIQLQLFISFMSLPFLIGWGLPISVLTPVSTLMFGPFLTCFLLVSSLIFFCELLYLPNGVLIWSLEKITTIWLMFLNVEQRAWLVGFVKPPLIVLFCIPLIALAAAHSKKISTLVGRVCVLALLLIGTCVLLKFFPYQAVGIETIACNKGAVTLIHHHNALILIDPGFISSRPSYESWIAYSLLPEVIQKTGRMSIDYCIIFKLNKRILDALQFLATKINIKNLYMPVWKGRIPPFAWRSYVKLKKTVAEYGGRIKSISYKTKLVIDETSMLFVEPNMANNICYYEATYQPLCVTGTINNQIFTL